MKGYRLEYQGPYREDNGAWNEHHQWNTLEFNAESDEEALAIQDFFKRKGIRVERLVCTKITERLVNDGTG